MDRIILIDELLEMLKNYSHTELHIHHTWRPNHQIYFDRPDPLYWQEAMRRFHVDTNGWSDIGQHVTLLPDGRFVTGRDFGRNPASIVGYNTNAFAVEMIGDFDIGKDPFDGPQKESALELARWFDQKGIYIRFHRETSSKTCPGSSIDKTAFLNEMRKGNDSYALPTLRRGNRGDAVAVLQEKLIRLGYDVGPVDGSFGPQTQSAVLAFQRDQNLEQDGVVGPKTRAALEAALKQLEPDMGDIDNRLNDLENRTKQIIAEIQEIRNLLA